MDLSDEQRTALVTEVDERFATFKRHRAPFEREWFRNLLFNVGNQWIKWDESKNGWRKRRLDAWVPTPVDNRFGSTSERLVAVLARVEPNWQFVPGSESEQDLAAAQVCEDLEAIIAEENHLADIRTEAARWLVATGNVFLWSGAEEKTSHQPGVGGMGMVADSGATAGPPAGAEEMALSGMGSMMPEAAAVGPSGPIPTMATPSDYRLYTDVLSPFEVLGDLSIPRLDQQDTILICQRKNKSWVKTLYGLDVPDGDWSGLGLDYLHAAGYLTAWTGALDAGAGPGKPTDQVTIKRILKAPCEAYPGGLYAVVINRQVVEAAAWPTDAAGEPYSPLIQIKFDDVPGAMFGRTPMNDIAPVQEQLNRLDSLIELIITRTAAPIWSLPDHTKVKSWEIGAPGSALIYTPMGDKAARPERIAGEQVPASVLQWRQSIIQSIEELGATFDAMKGKTPYAGAPGVVVDQLIEQGYSRFGTAFRNIAEGYRRWMKIQLELFRTYAMTPRRLPSLGENARWTIKQFSGADFSGAVSVRIESDSEVPRSDSAEIAKLMTVMAQAPQLVNLADPMVVRGVQKKLHLTFLTQAVDEDVLSAVQEHEALLESEKQPPMLDGMGQPVPPSFEGLLRVIPFIHNNPVHADRHRRFALSEEGRPFLDVLAQHIAEHHMIEDAMMTGAPTEPAGPTSPKKTGAPMNGNGQPDANVESALQPMGA